MLAAIRLAPKYALAYNNRGAAWNRKKDYAKAIADFNEALRLNPKLHLALVNSTWLLATCPAAEFRDGQKAVELGKQACEVSAWRDANDIANFAAAHAEAGNFEEAVKWQTKANEMYSPAERDQWGFLLQLYKDRKPYHEAPKA